MMQVFVLFFLVIVSPGIFAQTQKGVTYSYDSIAEKKAIDTLFQKYEKNVLELERKKISSLLPKEKVELYMKQFEEGMRSNTGIKMIEGGANQWLERAYHAGYQQKVLFEQGYLEGLTQSAAKQNDSLKSKE